MAASDQTRQVSIRVADRETDISLPAGIPIAELMPAVVDVIGAAEFSGTDPHLIRLCGQRLDPDKTLVQSAVHDGELLILTTAAPPAPITRFDVGGTVTDAIAALPEPTCRLVRRGAGHGVLGWSAAALLVLLGRAIADPTASRHPVVAAAATLLAMSGAVIVHRATTGRVTVMGLGVLAVVFAGLTAALLPLGPPGMPSFLVAMAAIASTSLLAWRLLGCATEVFLPLAVVAMAAAMTTMGAVAGCWPADTCGPMLACGSVAALAASARLSIHSSGLARARPADTDLDALARRAHHRLTLIVATAAAATALGAAVTAVTTSHPLLAAIFLAIIAALLILRTMREHIRYRIVAQSISSAIVVTALGVLCAVAAPQSIPWLCGVCALIATGAVWVTQREPVPIAPAVRGVISTVEVILGAAVVPGACAAAGMFNGLAQIGSAW